MLSPLPMRKMNASTATGEKSGMKRIAPTPVVAGICWKQTQSYIAIAALNPC